jgi:hypothetical protein
MNAGLKMAVSCVVAMAVAGPSRGQTASGEPRTYMEKVGFSAAEIATVESGKPVTRIVPEKDDNDASVVGVVRIKAPVQPGTAAITDNPRTAATLLMRSPCFPRRVPGAGAWARRPRARNVLALPELRRRGLAPSCAGER